MYLRAYLYRPKQLRDYLVRTLEPLNIGFHDFGVDEVPRHRWTCGENENGAW
jgi:hypothetical protein